METLEIIGFVGAGLILLGFYRVHIGAWGNTSLLYELDNLAGAAMLAYYSFQRGSYPALVLNVIWVIVALRGLESLAVRQKSFARQKRRKTK
jgi:hypothetical protein